MTPQESAIFECAARPESLLPETRPLALTQNFMWVVVVCFLSVQIVPLLIALTAGLIFH